MSKRSEGRHDHRLISGELRQGRRCGGPGSVEDTARHHGRVVVSMSAEVENDRISEYRTTVNIAFAVEA